MKTKIYDIIKDEGLIIFNIRYAIGVKNINFIVDDFFNTYMSSINNTMKYCKTSDVRNTIINSNEPLNINKNTGGGITNKIINRIICSIIDNVIYTNYSKRVIDKQYNKFYNKYLKKVLINSYDKTKGNVINYFTSDILKESLDSAVAMLISDEFDNKIIKYKFYNILNKIDNTLDILFTDSNFETYKFSIKELFRVNKDNAKSGIETTKNTEINDVCQLFIDIFKYAYTYFEIINLKNKYISRLNKDKYTSYIANDIKLFYSRNAESYLHCYGAMNNFLLYNDTNYIHDGNIFCMDNEKCLKDVITLMKLDDDAYNSQNVMNDVGCIVDDVVSEQFAPLLEFAGEVSSIYIPKDIDDKVTDYKSKIANLQDCIYNTKRCDVMKIDTIYSIINEIETTKLVDEYFYASNCHDDIIEVLLKFNMNDPSSIDSMCENISKILTAHNVKNIDKIIDIVKTCFKNMLQNTNITTNSYSELLEALKQMSCIIKKTMDKFINYNVEKELKDVLVSSECDSTKPSKSLSSYKIITFSSFNK